MTCGKIWIQCIGSSRENSKSCVRRKRRMAEVDPNGIDQHAAGAKLDAGKQRPALIVDAMPRAIAGVVSVGTFGANKYSDGGWLEVQGGIERYRDAQLRHESKRAMGEAKDKDSGLPHDFHIAWNVLAQVELKARRGDYDQ
jgi:Domain of unknown function (DUF5664)